MNSWWMILMENVVEPIRSIIQKFSGYNIFFFNLPLTLTPLKYLITFFNSTSLQKSFFFVKNINKNFRLKITPEIFNCTFLLSKTDRLMITVKPL